MFLQLLPKGNFFNFSCIPRTYCFPIKDISCFMLTTFFLLLLMSLVDFLTSSCDRFQSVISNFFLFYLFDVGYSYGIRRFGCFYDISTFVGLFNDKFCACSMKISFFINSQPVALITPFCTPFVVLVQMEF